jgi:hypothetical protein
MLLKHKSKRGGHFHVSYFDTGHTREETLDASRPNRPRASLGRFDDAQRGAHPDTHGVLLKRCAPPDENYSLFASSNNMEMRPGEAPKCTSHEHRQRASRAAQQSGAHGSPPASKVTGGIVGRFLGARKRDHSRSTVNAKSKRRGFRPRRITVKATCLLS